MAYTVKTLKTIPKKIGAYQIWKSGLFDLIELALLFVRAATPATSWARTDSATSIQGMTLIYVAARMAVERRGSNFANPA